MKPLSSSGILNAVVFPIIVLIVTLIFIAVTPSTEFNGPYAVVLIVSLFASGIGTYMAVANSYNIYYDDQFIYLKGFGGSNTQIPLTSITSIKKNSNTMKVTAVSSWRYTLEFESTFQIRPQMLWQPEGTNAIKTFIEVVKNVNNQVITD